MEGIDLYTGILLITNAVLVGVSFGSIKKQLEALKDMHIESKIANKESLESLKNDLKEKNQEINFQLVKYNTYGERLATLESKVDALHGRLDEVSDEIKNLKREAK